MKLHLHFIKKTLLLSTLLITSIYASIPAFAKEKQNTLSSPKQQSTPAILTTTKPYISLRIKPLANANKRFQHLIQALHIPQEFQLMPFILLGHLGYPNFSCIDPTSNTSIFAFETTTNQANYITLVHVTNKPAFLKPLPAYQLKYREFNHWVLLSESQELLSSLSNEAIQNLISLNNAPLSSDLIIEYHPFNAKIPLIQQACTAPENSSPQEDCLLSNFIPNLLTSAEQDLESATLAINFDPQTLSIIATAAFNPGTTEFEFCNQTLPGTISPFTQYLSSNTLLTYTGQFNPNALSSLINSTITNIQKTTPSVPYKETLENFRSVATSITNTSNGLFAGASDLDQNFNPLFQLALSGNFTPATFTDAFTTIQNKIIPNLNDASGNQYTFTFNPAFDTGSNNTPIFQTQLNYTPSTKMPTENGKTQMDIQRFFAIHNGTALISDNPTLIKLLLQAIAQEAPAPNNPSLIFHPQAHLMTQFQINARTAIETYADYSHKTPAQEPSTLQLLPNITGFTAIEKGALSFHIHLPVTTLSAFATEFNNKPTDHSNTEPTAKTKTTQPSQSTN